MQSPQLFESEYHTFSLQVTPQGKRVGLKIVYSSVESWYPRFTPQQARELAAALNRAADQAEGKQS